MSRFEELLKPYLQGPLRRQRAWSAGRTTAAGSIWRDAWSVRPSRELLDKLSALVGREGWYLVYGPRNDIRGEETSSWR